MSIAKNKFSDLKNMEKSAPVIKETVFVHKTYYANSMHRLDDEEDSKDDMEDDQEEKSSNFSFSFNLKPEKML